MELSVVKRNMIRLDRAKSYLLDVNNYIAIKAEENNIEFNEYGQFNDNIQIMINSMQKLIKSMEMIENAK